MYLHFKPSKEFNPQDIFDFITNLETEDVNRCGYFFESSTNLKRFQANFTRLILHPQIRPDQDKWQPIVFK